MRDDSTVRLSARSGAAQHDDPARTAAIESASGRAASEASDGASDGGSDDATRRHPIVGPASDDASATAAAPAAPPAEEGHERHEGNEGHRPGPGLVIPPAARERREDPPPEDRPVMPGPPPSERPSIDDRADRSRSGAEDATRAVRPTTGDAPGPLASPSAQTVRTAPPHRPAASPSARPAAPPRPAGPRPIGPGRTTMNAGAPRASAGPSRARANAPEPRRGVSRARRAGGILGGIALGLVALVAASWTLLVPPAGHDAAGGRRPPVAAAPAEPGVRWVRTNGDEFDGSGLDRTRWNVYNSVGGFGNGLRRPSAVAQNGGLLTITARPRLAGGTSGGIAMGKGQLHGRWEFRARADPGVGYSPAVLLWPDSERFPIDGELDMLESPDGARRTASSYVHYGADNKTRGAEVPGDFTQWHTFAFEWLPDRITWYVDGRKSWEIRDRSVIPTKPMHLCIQLDQGPAVKFMPAPDASTPDEVRMQVDWARQYRAG